MKPCPSCGYENRQSAWKCGLCGTVFPEAQKAPLEPLATEDATEMAEVTVELARRDFRTEMAYNRRQSFLLLLCFPAILVMLGWGIGLYWGNDRIGIAIAAGVSLIYLSIAYFAGDRIILSFSGAHPADPQRHRILINVVDEMRIAAGQPMPEVYVIETDAANAFATGRDPQHAKVAVTEGLIKILSRDELQGVVAHEMSHVRNFDIRYMMLVAALVGAVALLTDGLRRSFWWGGFGGRGRKSSGRGAGGQGQIIVFLVVIVLAILAPFFAMMLQMAISRKREFLADASAVELTRNPLGLASALEKLDKYREHIPLECANRATQHLYIVNPLRGFGMKSRALFSTHPPIEARVRLLKSMT